MTSPLYRLSLFEEAAGRLHELSVEQDMLIAHVGKNHLALPYYLEPSLRPLIGQSIAILHTDLPEKPYLYRVLVQANEPTENKTELRVATLSRW